ncbi:hypothetical protein P9139_11775 [Curtobacterium flaccumfaciens]|nr:hypothetical protein P9139_11775 [Curtobacterium flaccumfaciens]
MSDTSTPFDSLDAALRARRIPIENHRFIADLLAWIDVEGYYDTSTYIKVVRVDGGPALQIASGYTNGFRSEDEIVRAVGDVERWPSALGSSQWGVSHPVNSLRETEGGGRSERERARCTACGAELPLSGECDFCR